MVEDRIIDIVVTNDDVSWQNVLVGLVRKEGMDPWDINITTLTQKYIGMLKELKELDFRVTGKMVLAAALLLRLKTKKLIGDDMMELDKLMRPQEEEYSEEGFYDELEAGQQPQAPHPGEIPQLLPRTPQPRQRKVSIYDLIGALQKALEVRDRRVVRRLPTVEIKLPERKIDMSKITASIYERIMQILAAESRATYAKLLATDRHDEKIMTFWALLHLADHEHGKISLVQKEPFGEIEIILREAQQATKA